MSIDKDMRLDYNKKEAIIEGRNGYNRMEGKEKLDLYNKIHCTVSKRTIEVIKDDKERFGVSSMSSFINLIIRSYCKEYIETVYERDRKLQCILDGEEDTDYIPEKLDRKSIYNINVLFNSDMKETKTSRRKGTTGDILITPGSGNAAELYLLMSAFKKKNNDLMTGYDAMLNALNSMFESYASLPVCKREIILNYNVYRTIKDVVDGKNKYTMSFYVPHGANPVHDRIMVYDIVPNRERIHNYVIGISEESGRFFSCRLDRIYNAVVNCDVLAGDFSEEELDCLEYMAKDCPEFAYGEEGMQDIQVKFSDEGLYLFDNIIKTHKPVEYNVEEKDNHIIHFNCPLNQLYIYLRKFGADAVVLQPAELREKMKKYYTEAMEAYND